VSETTRTLLDHWFSTPHRMTDGSFFSWYPHQRRAIETVIFLHEACRVRRLADFAAVAGSEVGDQRDPWPKLGLWMATGSGKTKVMSLLAAWAFLNEKLEGDHLGLESLSEGSVACEVRRRSRAYCAFASGSRLLSRAMVAGLCPSNWLLTKT